MSADGDAILEHLRTVDAERRRRAASPDLGVRVAALKAYQQRRFSHTYADLLATSRYGPAARFFLDELYGPDDFSQRDAQFARVVPALVRLFPHEVVGTVRTLAELHALSEVLDSIAALHLPEGRVDTPAYVRAWQEAGREHDRERQIALTLSVGESLDRLTQHPLVRHSLRMMRGPARAAGLAELQRFLETGFDTFRAMRGSREFLSTVGSRERALAQALFAARFDEEGHLGDIALGQLP
ncbi:FFLEELY motif protein [Piscinibacter sp.]|uniref:FFLEELY motif protein n=1 Tax=Piscinibacter sp. TaxID=1903157 RepID=UPI002CC0460C|nr:hypothetical protein [Albitalea sp.]HUG25305.1 hypothetical protein [Albitalea sp.]